MPEPRVLTDEELNASVVQGDARDLLTTARHHRARAEKAERELATIDAALDSVTKCQAASRAERIRDSYAHNELVCDAVVFDAEKAEQSARAQVVYWMGMFQALGGEVDALRTTKEQAEQAARRMARLLMDQERRGPFDYDNVPGGLVPRRPEMEVVFTTLGLPCPCPRDRWNKEAALREPEKGEG